MFGAHAGLLGEHPASQATTVSRRQRFPGDPWFWELQTYDASRPSKRSAGGGERRSTSQRCRQLSLTCPGGSYEKTCMAHHEVVSGGQAGRLPPDDNRFLAP